MTYLPKKLTASNCVYILDKDTIRVFDKNPNNQSTNYIDYFINSHYLSKTGRFTYQSYYNNPYTCENHVNFTNSYMYRNDFTFILINVFILSFFIIYLPFKVISRALHHFLYI